MQLDACFGALTYPQRISFTTPHCLEDVQHGHGQPKGFNHDAACQTLCWTTRVSYHHTFKKRDVPNITQPVIGRCTNIAMTQRIHEPRQVRTTNRLRVRPTWNSELTVCPQALGHRCQPGGQSSCHFALHYQQTDLLSTQDGIR